MSERLDAIVAAMLNAANEHSASLGQATLTIGELERDGVTMTGFRKMAEAAMIAAAPSLGGDGCSASGSVQAEPRLPQANHDAALPAAVSQERGWLPIVLCPTDGVDRALLLPDGREVVGAYHNPGGWRVCSTIEHDAPVFETQRHGLLPLDPTRKAPEEARRQVGTRKAQMRLYGSLPEGVYPTHFRPNDTAFGLPTPTSQEAGHAE